MQQQIPFGNDSKKSKNNNDCKGEYSSSCDGGLAPLFEGPFCLELLFHLGGWEFVGFAGEHYVEGGQEEDSYYQVG